MQELFILHRALKLNTSYTKEKFAIFFFNRKITLIRKSTFYCGVSITYFLREISLLNFRTLEIGGTETL